MLQGCREHQSQGTEESQYVYIWTVSVQLLLSTLLIQFKLVYGLFGQSNMHSTLDSCPIPARKETNVPLQKRSLELTFLIFLRCAPPSFTGSLVCTSRLAKLKPRPFKFIQLQKQTNVCTTVRRNFDHVHQALLTNHRRADHTSQITCFSNPGVLLVIVKL